MSAVVKRKKKLGKKNYEGEDENCDINRNKVDKMFVSYKTRLEEYKTELYKIADCGDEDLENSYSDHLMDGHVPRNDEIHDGHTFRESLHWEEFFGRKIIIF